MAMSEELDDKVGNDGTGYKLSVVVNLHPRPSSMALIS